MRRLTLRSAFGTLAMLAVTGSLVSCGLVPVPYNTKAESSSTEPTSVEEPTTQEPDVSTVDVELTSDGMDTYALTETAQEDASYAGETVGYMGETVDFNTEEYASVEESGFVSAKTSPLSTVSADVDTASYANLRRMLNEGYKVQPADDGQDDDADGRDSSDEETETEGEVSELYPDYYAEANQVIPTGAVRIEEMLNYFDYDYALPKGDDKFAITSKIGPCPWNEDTELLVLGFATAPEDESVAKKGSNIVLLIDVSGSMDDADKLPLLQSSCAELVSTLDENDRVSIVTYSGEEQVVLEGAKGSESRQIMKAIRGLKAEGSTNGEAGLRMAYQVAEDNFIKGGVNRIVLASDGDLNVGMTSESDLHDFVEKKRDNGVYLSVLGFGAGNYKDTKMETLADHGNGSYHYIDCEQEAKRVFGSRLCANLVPFADDVKVQVEFNPAQVKGYRLVGYENRTMAAEDFEDDEKDAGDVGPSSQFTVVYEVAKADSKLDIATPELKYGQEEGAATSDEWMTVSLRYKPVGASDVVEQQTTIDKSDWAEVPSQDWRFAAAVTEFGMLLRDSEFVGTASYDGVRELVGDTKDDLRLGFLDLVDMAEKN